MKTFIEATEDYLQIADRPKTVREIYSKIKDEIAEHPGDPYVTLSGILVQQVKKSNSKIIVVDYNKPKTLWLKSGIPELEGLGIKLETSEYFSFDSGFEKDEKDLYPLLIEILREENAIYSKRIDEKITEKGTKGLNKWINPDIVGVKFFFEEHCNEVNDLIVNSSSPLYEMYSYEVKKEIKLANIKECYF